MCNLRRERRYLQEQLALIHVCNKYALTEWIVKTNAVSQVYYILLPTLPTLSAPSKCPI